MEKIFILLLTVSKILIKIILKTINGHVSVLAERI